ncbi:MAG: hypothetical protein CSA22_09770 [Deltaproteobacteria bacterium]|nr:MAG: hypothetical protein CSA22_09770 [Deltaproteobacteria bacterium]
MRLHIVTTCQTEFIDITSKIAAVVRAAGMTDGMVFISSVHTTGAITINENADPDVTRDLAAILDRMVPWENGYHHREGNAAAHMKTSLMGASEWVAVENGKLVLGTWQGIYFCEFDGPRQRQVVVKLIDDSR